MGSVMSLQLTPMGSIQWCLLVDTLAQTRSIRCPRALWEALTSYYTGVFTKPLADILHRAKFWRVASPCSVVAAGTPRPQAPELQEHPTPQRALALREPWSCRAKCLGLPRWSHWPSNPQICHLLTSNKDQLLLFSKNHLCRHSLLKMVSKNLAQ